VSVLLWPAGQLPAEVFGDAGVPVPTPVHGGGSHVIVIVVVSSVALHADPAGTGPSPATTVTVAEPTCVHVKLVVAVFGSLKEPVEEDQAYVSVPGFGPVASAASATELPTVTSSGLADTELKLAQS
jgi:hypothetical protein